MACVCGNELSTEECCLPFIKGDKKPETAEALMRSRYAAYVLEEVDYVIATHVEKGREDIDREGADNWSKQADWEGLEIVSTEAGGAADDSGMVEFIAHYGADGTSVSHHERSRFTKVDGTWFYLDGEMVKVKPTVRETPKVGRNEPCPCGSGKKFKKCCGG